MHRGVCVSNHLRDADEGEWQDPTWEGPVIAAERRREEGSGTSLGLAWRVCNTDVQRVCVEWALVRQAAPVTGARLWANTAHTA